MADDKHAKLAYPPVHPPPCFAVFSLHRRLFLQVGPTHSSEATKAAAASANYFTSMSPVTRVAPLRALALVALGLHGMDRSDRTTSGSLESQVNENVINLVHQ